MALFRAAQMAWDARDRGGLARLVGPDLLVEWERRLDDFDRKGWHNRVEVLEDPNVLYVGITNGRTMTRTAPWSASRPSCGRTWSTARARR